MEREERAPAWLAVLVGGLATAAALRALAVPGHEEKAAVEVPAPRTLPPSDLARMSPRGLRALPGIGQVRAIEYVRHRWRHDPSQGPLAIEDVRGIGPKTARSVAEAMEGPP